MIPGRGPRRSADTDTIGAVSVGFAIQYDDAGSGITYIGKAKPGSSTSAPVWQIMKLDESSAPDFALTWADGNGLFDNVWANRASLSYS